MEKKSNIVSMSYWRKDKAKRKSPLPITTSSSAPSYQASLEKRIAELEAEVDRLVTAVVDATNLAEANREHLLKLMKLLKEKL